jgi:Leucine-rich repeat (LRR) protein
VALYNSVDGPNWDNNTNWLVSPVEYWFGILVSGNRVIKIELQRNGLKGPLPDAIGDLSALTHLDMNNNQISGSIPESIGQLTGLKMIRLGVNDITGTVPSSLGNRSVFAWKFDTAERPDS